MAPSVPGPEPIAPVQGSWVGTNSEGDPIAFILEGSVLSFFQLGLRLPDGAGGTCRYSGAVYGLQLARSSSEFQFEFNQRSVGGGSLRALIRGRFVSSREASVTFDTVTYSSADCGRGVVTGTRPGGTVTLLPATTIDDYLGTCPTPPEIARIDSDLRLEFLDDPTAGTRPCSAGAGSADLSRMKLRVYQALLLMQRLEFNSPLPWTTSATLYEWFVGVVRGIRFSSSFSISSCCNPARVLNVVTGLASFQESSNTPGVRSQTIVSTMGLFLHEARHAEGWRHSCGTDDRTIDEMAAWGVQYYWNLWASNHTRAPSTVFMLPARAAAVDSARTLCSGFDRRSQGRFCRVAYGDCPDPLAQ
jgi:hypothetical protein